MAARHGDSLHAKTSVKTWKVKSHNKIDEVEGAVKAGTGVLGLPLRQDRRGGHRGHRTAAALVQSEHDREYHFSRRK